MQVSCTDMVHVPMQYTTVRHTAFMRAVSIAGSLSCNGVRSHLWRHSKVPAADVVVVLLGELAPAVALHEVHDLRRQPRRRARVHLIARPHELPGNGQVIRLPALPCVHSMHVPQRQQPCSNESKAIIKMCSTLHKLLQTAMGYTFRSSSHTLQIMHANHRMQAPIWHRTQKVSSLHDLSSSLNG